MNVDIVRDKLPEERELEKKRTELEKLEIQLTELELERVTLRANMQSFERQYILKVGRLYADLDAIEAEAAELLASANPTDAELLRKAREASSAAQATRLETNFYSPQETKEDFQPSEDLKRLYRRVAKHIHPDLANNDEDRIRRHQAMVEANRAYETGDDAQLLVMLQEWSADVKIQNEDTGARLILVIRQIAQVERRIDAIKSEIDGLKHSELYVFLDKREAAKSQGRDLLAEMAASLQSQLSIRRQALADLKATRGKP